MSLENLNFVALWKDILSKFHNSEEKNIPLNIPLLPFAITPAILNQLLIAGQHLWMNMPASAIEVISDEQGTLIDVFLHKADQDGMYIELLKIDLVSFPVKELKFAEMDGLFEKIKNWVKKQYNVDIGNVRHYPISAIQQLSEIYQTYCNSQKHLQNVLVLIGRYLDCILDAIEKQICFFYPNALVFDYFLALRKFFGGLSIQKFGEFLTQIIPDTDITASLYDDNSFLTYHLFHENHQFQLKHIPNPELLPSGEELITRHEYFLKQIAKLSPSKHTFLFQLKAIVDLLYDIFQTPIPADGPRVRHIFQKALYRYRGVGVYWNVYPRPILYFAGFRFLAYLLGYHLNLQKISHWAIPDIISNLLNKVFGLTGQIVVICGENFSDLKNISSNGDIYAQLLKYDNGMFTEAAKLKESDLNVPSEFQLNFELGERGEQREIEKIRLYLSDKFGYIHSVIWISTNSLKTMLKTILLDLHSHTIKIKNITESIKCIQNPKDFTISPDNPIYNYLKHQKPTSILKKIAPIITDLNEF